MASILVTSLFGLAIRTAHGLEADPPLLIARNAVGGTAIGPCSNPRVSATGRYVVQICGSADIVPNDNNDHFDTFLVDVQTRQTTRLSVDANGNEYPYGSSLGFSSADGTDVVFSSAAPLTPDAITYNFDLGTSGVFRRNRANGTIELISRDNHNVGAFPGNRATLRDVNFFQDEVLFSSTGAYIGPNPYSFNENLYVRNWITGALERVTSRPDGSISSGMAATSALSADGRYVIFASSASDIAPGPPPGRMVLFERDRLNQATRRLLYPWNGGDFVTGSLNPFGIRISDDNRWITFDSSDLEGITADDNPAAPDVYLMDRQSGVVQLVSRSFNGAPTGTGSFSIDISADGRFVVFFSRALNLQPSPAAFPAIYVKDRLTGELLNISAPLGTPGNFIPRVHFSADGGTVVFDWNGVDPSLPADQFGRFLTYQVKVHRGAQPVAAPALTSMGALVLIAGLGLLAGLSSSRRS